MNKSDLKNNHQKSISYLETYHIFVKLSYQNVSKCIERKTLNTSKENLKPKFKSLCFCTNCHFTFNVLKTSVV